MKRILYLAFFFDPDISAGSFRNTALSKELANQLSSNGEIDLFTTHPNRYSTFQMEAPEKEVRNNLHIRRIFVPGHKNGMMDQIYSFRMFYNKVIDFTSGTNYDLVFASSSKFFTAYLGYHIAKKKGIPLYLDIRDIFHDTLKDILKNPLAKSGILPLVKHLERRVFNYAVHVNLVSGGFETYFRQYKHPDYSFFTNGIDPEFLNTRTSVNGHQGVKVITYAGNIGEGQGLDKIVPQAAKALEGHYKFLIIGDGGTKQKLLKAIEGYHLENVEVRQPVSRKELLEIYLTSDYLFIHLNDYEAFEKVLPSKIFELGACDKPIIAGVGGYAKQFLKENVSNLILFPPGDVDGLVKGLQNNNYATGRRKEFIEKFKRDHINKEMAASIISYLR